MASGRNKLMFGLFGLAALASTNFLSYHAGRQSVDEVHIPLYQLNDLVFENSPQPLRTKFKEEFGFPLQGFELDIEKRPEQVSGIIQELYFQKLISPYELSSFRVEPEEERLQSREWSDIRSRHPNLVGTHVDNSVHVLSGSVSGTAHHEVIHDKVKMLEASNSPIFKEWSELSKDEDGNTLYHLVQSQGDKKSPEDKCSKDEDCHELGFVRKEARHKISEDIAYLCEEAVINPEGFIGWLYDNPNPKIKGKVELAQKYELIPQDFSEYVALKKILKEAEDFSSIDMNKIALYFKASEMFLNENPSSLYGAEVHYQRAFFLRTAYPEFTQPGHEDELEAIVNELEKVILAPYFDPLDYSQTLGHLSDIYSAVGQEEKAEIFNEADLIFISRYDSADPDFIVSGAYDFLSKKKVL